MAEEFKHLFTPCRIGSMEVRNRIVSTAHFTRYGRDYLPSEQHAYYYAEKAKGGIGLIVMEQLSVHVTSVPFPSIVLAYDERSIPGFQRISSMVHECDGKILGELNHSGQHSVSLHSMRETWAPSALPCVLYNSTPKEMEIQDIKEVVQGFRKAARNLRAGGFDGVEIHAAHGYLPAQFLSPVLNKRTDEYGGSLENRLRFTYEVIDAVREECGNDFVVGIRISGDELAPGGSTLEDTKVVVQRLEATGKLDYFSVSIANYNSYKLLVPPMFVPLGFAVYCAAGVKEVVEKTPVFTIGRINDPLLAERILAEGHADMIGMTRATIADPELPNKAREGRLSDIRTCVACNEGCNGRAGRNSWVSCLQNPAAGREKELGIGTLTSAAVKKKVMVIGGGPAGMEAARVAALRGHNVSLYEKEVRLGGQINVLTKAPSREEFGGVTRWQTGQLQKLGVEIHLKTEVAAHLVSKLAPDVVIVATGSAPVRTGYTPMRPEVSEIPGVHQDNVLAYWDALLDVDKVGEKVVLVDDDHSSRAACTAEFLSDSGRKVEVICRLPLVATDTVATNHFGFIYPKLVSKGVVMTTDTWCKEISGKRVIVYNVHTNQERAIDEVDTVVLATGNKADDGLYRELRGKVPEVYAIGDCLAPRKAIDAIFDGHRIGREI